MFSYSIVLKKMTKEEKEALPESYKPENRPPVMWDHPKVQGEEYVHIYRYFSQMFL